MNPNHCQIKKHNMPIFISFTEVGGGGGGLADEKPIEAAVKTATTTSYSGDIVNQRHRKPLHLPGPQTGQKGVQQPAHPYGGRGVLRRADAQLWQAIAHKSRGWVCCFKRQRRCHLLLLSERSFGQCPLRYPARCQQPACC